jgi:putative zinc finger/helix-turn-helix YgiT family protein
VAPTVTAHTAHVKHEGVVHELRFSALRLPRCTKCGETIVTEDVDAKINDALRRRLRLLTPAQMRQGIRQVGLNQLQLAERLGVAPETISRWLNGALIQSRAMDNLLRVFFALPQVRKVLRGEKQDRRLGVKV